MRSHAGAGAGIPAVALPANRTSAGPESRCPPASASAGFTWHTAQSNPGEIALAATCEVCAPIRIASPSLPHVAVGGAPVWLSLPPWHIVQFTFQLAMPAGKFWS